MAQATSRLRGGSPKDGSDENLKTSTKRQKGYRLNFLPLSENWRASPIARRKQRAKGAACRGINEVVISRRYQLFGRIAASVHDGFDRVIASRADKQFPDADCVLSGTPASGNTDRLVY
jgi:hypothetical protein